MSIAVSPVQRPYQDRQGSCLFYIATTPSLESVGHKVSNYAIYSDVCLNSMGSVFSIEKLVLQK